MTQERLIQLSEEAEVSYPKLLILAAKALHIGMRPRPMLIVAICKAAEAIGDVEAETLILAAANGQ